MHVLQYLNVTGDVVAIFGQPFTNQLNSWSSWFHGHLRASWFLIFHNISFAIFRAYFGNGDTVRKDSDDNLLNNTYRQLSGNFSAIWKTYFGSPCLTYARCLACLWPVFSLDWIKSISVVHRLKWPVHSDHSTDFYLLLLYIHTECEVVSKVFPFVNP